MRHLPILGLVSCVPTLEPCLTDDDGIPATPEGYVPVTDVHGESPYAACVDGFVQVMSQVSDTQLSGRVETHEAFATFFHETDPAWEVAEGALIDPLEGPEDCGVVWTNGEGMAALGGPAWNDAGTVSITSPASPTPLDLDPVPGGTVLNYRLDLGLPPGFGDSYDFDTTGSAGSGSWDGTAALALPGAVTLPERLEVTAPVFAPDLVIPRVDTEILWTGTGEGEVEIELSGGAGRTWNVLRCIADDDGAFTIPAALLTAMPAGPFMASLAVSREIDTWTDTTAGRRVHGQGLAWAGMGQFTLE